MRIENARRSTNVIDQRGGGGGRRRGPGGKLGIGATIAIALVALALGADPAQVIGLLSGGGGTSAPPAPAPPATESASASMCY